MKNNHGFTLIEVIIYTGLFTVLIFGLIQASHTLLSDLDRHDARTLALEEGTFLIEKIDALLSGADVVYEPALNATSTLLRLKNAGSFHRFQASTTDVLYKKDFGELLPINNSNVVIKDFVVEHGVSGSEPAWVRCTFTIEKIEFSIIRYTRL